jgi:hypothetical protein
MCFESLFLPFSLHELINFLISVSQFSVRYNLPTYCRCRGYFLHRIKFNDSQYDSLQREFSPAQWPLHDNTQPLQDTDIHDPEWDSNPQSQQANCTQTHALDRAARFHFSYIKISDKSHWYTGSYWNRFLRIRLFTPIFLCYDKLINKSKVNDICIRVLVCSVCIKIINFSMHL